jgi:plastocyanin
MLGSRRKALAGGTFAAIMLVTALVIVATGSAKGGQTLRLKASASGALKFDKKKLTARPGKATVVMVNPKSSGLKHGIEVTGKGGEKRGANVGPGHTSRVTVTLKKGTYTFYCPVDGHKNAGMKGTIVVK